MNKNVADYTNFDGKTNKKIVQSPGGLSSISLGWGNEPALVNYKERPSKKADHPPSITYEDDRMHQKYDSRNLRLMGDYEAYGEARSGPQDISGNDHRFADNSHLNKGVIGGEHGYNNIEGRLKYQRPQETAVRKYQTPTSHDLREQIKPSDIYKPSSLNSQEFHYKQQERQMDAALEQQTRKLESNRTGRPKPESQYDSPNKRTSVNQGSRQNSMNNTPSSKKSQSGGRSCIRIQEPQKSHNVIVGDYNYWYNQKQFRQQDGYDEKYSRKGLHGRPQLSSMNQGISNNPYYGQNVTTQEKTSVKVHNPPGGKSNFTFG